MSLEQRIKFFNFIRDIPYKIALGNEQDYCCATKSFMLAHLLESIGLKTRQVICKFDWQETPLPEEILSLPFNPEEATHQYLQAFIPERNLWVNIDPTWDSPLASLGFTIEAWDGLNDTGLAVASKKTLSPNEADELIVKYSEPHIMKHYMAHHREFFEALNRWLAGIRIDA